MDRIKDYRKIYYYTCTIIYILLLIFSSDDAERTMLIVFPGAVFYFTITILLAPDTPIAKLAKRDFAANIKDNELYELCNEYRQCWDGLKSREIAKAELEADRIRKENCKIVFNNRMRKV